MKHILLLMLTLCCMFYSYVTVENSGEPDVCRRKCENDADINCTRLKSAYTGRCCTDDGDVSIVTGLDLRGCNLTSAEGLFTSMNRLLELYLEDNPSLHTLNEDDFSGVSKLQHLSIPSGLECPGGVEAWKSIKKENNSTLCIDEIDTCTEHNVTCPNTHSHCVNTGPGMTGCLCRNGYHGYKCLRSGSFPVAYFITGIVVSTLVLSAVLWFTQRLHVKKKNA